MHVGTLCERRVAAYCWQVFDTGRHAVGGRVSSRALKVEGKGGKSFEVKVDHSTQFFTATDPRFVELVGCLQKEGAVKEWTGRVGKLEDGKFSELERAEKMWVGRHGIDAVPRTLAKGLRTVTGMATHLRAYYHALLVFSVEIACLLDATGFLRADTWVAAVERQEDTGKWRLFLDNSRRRRLSAKETQDADFDYIVVAHNGKCAERLMRDAQVPSLHRLLKTKFACTPAPAGVMQLCSLWVMTFVVDTGLGLDFEGAFIEGHPDLCWAADNTKKLGASPPGDVEAWTLISSRAYGTRNKVPQEAVPPEVEERVANELLRAFEASAGLPLNSISPVARRLQLWGAGVPMNVMTGAPCVLDKGTCPLPPFRSVFCFLSLLHTHPTKKKTEKPQVREDNLPASRNHYPTPPAKNYKNAPIISIYAPCLPAASFLSSLPVALHADSAAGICGDWLVEPSVQGAALSGIELAEAIARDAAGGMPGSVGIPVNADACMVPGQLRAVAAFGAACASPLLLLALQKPTRAVALTRWA